MIIVGIDPGKNGGIATITKTAVQEGNKKGYEDIQIEKTICWDDENFINFIKNNNSNIQIVMVEKVWGQKWDTPKTAFSLGHSLGFIEAILQAFSVPYQLVPPQRWKKEYSLNSDKQKSIDCCKKLFPKVNLKRTERCTKDHDGMAEALLIAEYGRRHFNDKR